jgi:cell division septum initiation protein DivIVA
MADKWIISGSGMKNTRTGEIKMLGTMTDTEYYDATGTYRAAPAKAPAEATKALDAISAAINTTVGWTESQKQEAIRYYQAHKDDVYKARTDWGGIAKQLYERIIPPKTPVPEIPVPEIPGSPTGKRGAKVLAAAKKAAKNKVLVATDAKEQRVIGKAIDKAALGAVRGLKGGPSPEAAEIKNAMSKAAAKPTGPAGPGVLKHLREMGM